VRVTHGKAVRLDGKRPMIKSHVNTWLRQHSQVLGFTSCQAKHGGAGAVYVMLKRTMMEGRDE
jgi:DNA-nicking Smr family endonuclease